MTTATAIRLMRGEPLPIEHFAIQRHAIHPDADTAYAAYLEGWRRSRARLMAHPGDVRDWLDAADTIGEVVK